MTKLKRALGLWELVLIGVGIILGAGIYVIIGSAAGMAGNALWLSFGIAAVTALFTGLSYAELSSRFPKAGGEYVYTSKAFNKRLAFIIGWFMIFGSIIAASTVALGFSGYLTVFLGTNIVLTSIALLFLLCMLLIYGIKESAWFAIICSVIEAGGLIIIIFLGIPYFGTVDYLEFPDIAGVLGAASLVFFAFIGFEDMVNMAEEVKNPVKTLPKAVLISVAITTILYILVAISAVSILGWERLSTSPAPLAEVASEAFMGNEAFALLGIIALFATANTVLLILLGASRLLYGMADNGVLPKVLAKVHKTRQTPWVAIATLMIVAMAFVLIGDLGTVASLTNASILFVFLAINLGVIMIRYKEHRGNKDVKGTKKFFKTPLNIGWVPLFPILGVLTCAFLLANIELHLVLLALLLAVPGLIVYELINRKKN